MNDERWRLVGQRKHFSLYKYTYCTLSKQTRFNDLQNKHVSIRKEKNLNALHIWGGKTTKFPIRIEQTKTLALQLHVHKFPTTQLKIEVSMSSKQTQSRRL